MRRSFAPVSSSMPLMTCGLMMRMKPARQIRSGFVGLIASSKACSKSCFVSKFLCGIVAVLMPAFSARSRP